MRRRATLLTAALIAHALACVAAAQPGAVETARNEGGPAMLAASGDEHMWFVIEATPARPLSAGRKALQIYHHALDMGGPYFTVSPEPMALAHRPEGLAAWGDQLWLIMEPAAGQKSVSREVYSVRAVANHALGGYSFVPGDRLEVAPALPGGGRLAGAVGTADGPIVLLTPPQWVAAGVRGAGSTMLPDPGLDRPMLMQLRSAGWVQRPLPDGLDRAGGLHLAAAGPDGSELWLFGDLTIAPGQPTTWRFLDNGWHSAPGLRVDPARVRAMIRCASAAMMIREGSDRQDIEAAYLRPSMLLSLARWPDPGGKWCLAGLRDSVRVVRQSGSGELTMTTIDATTGQVSNPQPMNLQARALTQVIHLPILLAVGLSAILTVLLLRPSEADSRVKLPPTMTILSPMSRLAAVAIDLLPGAVLAMLSFDAQPTELVKTPLSSVTLDEAIPSLVMVAITVLHSTVSELLSARTLGKAAVGGMVVANDGSPASAKAIIIRNLYKAVMLCIPLLVVVAVMNPHWKGMGDVIARTVVVRRRDKDEPLHQDGE